jgi:fimbrial chaperone protein
MRMIVMSKIVLFIGFIFYSIASFAFSVSISPILLELDSKHQITSFTVTNKADTKVTFQLSTMKWEQKKGTDITTNTNDLIITPPIITIPAGAEQIVRVGMRNPTPRSIEGTYRIILKQLPIDIDSKDLKKSFTAGLRMILAFSVPLFITPVQEIKRIDWEIKKIPSHKLRLKLTNKGNVHVTITKLLLQDASESVHFSPEVVGRVLSGQSREWVLSLKKTLIGKGITIKATTDWNDKYRELNVTVPIN